MSTNSANDYKVADPTPILQNLAEKAGNETREEALAAKDTPVSRLTYTAGCRDVTAEYYKTYHKVSRVLDIWEPRLTDKTCFLRYEHP
jgi:hypothetical protein